MIRRPTRYKRTKTLFPNTTLVRARVAEELAEVEEGRRIGAGRSGAVGAEQRPVGIEANLAVRLVVDLLDHLGRRAVGRLVGLARHLLGTPDQGAEAEGERKSTSLNSSH